MLHYVHQLINNFVFVPVVLGRQFSVFVGAFSQLSVDTSDAMRRVRVNSIN